jgi:hypothetical protein
VGSTEIPKGLKEAGRAEVVSDEYDEDAERGDEWIAEEEFIAGYVSEAKTEILSLIVGAPDGVFFERQLQVLLERRFYHWVTSRAADELAKDGQIQSGYLPLGMVRSTQETGPRMRFFYRRGLRYWVRKAAKVIDLVKRYSAQEFTYAVGHQAEMLFDAALARVGFMPVAQEAAEYEGVRWGASGHDLDRIYMRDGIAYGAEIKNKLGYVDRSELDVKLRMCRYLGLRPLMIMRALPKSWHWEVVRDWGGFCLIFGFQLYPPFGFEALAREVRDTLGLPVDCPRAIQEGTVKRLLDWHLKNV